MRLERWAALAAKSATGLTAVVMAAFAVSATVSQPAWAQAGATPVGAKPAAKSATPRRAATPPVAAILPAPAVLTTAADGTLVMRVTRGKQVTLPLGGVTRIIPADDDVVRGFFNDGGKAGLEGVTTGTTLVEIYQGEDQRQLVSVQVDEPGTSAAATSAAASATRAASASGAPAPGSTVSPLPSGSPVVVPSGTPVVVATGDPTAARPAGPAPGMVTADRTRLFVSLRVSPVEDNPSQALFTATYGNRSQAPARNAVLRTSLDDVVSYVTGSATGSPRYDAAARELVWNLGTLEPGANGGSVSWRVEPIERSTMRFYTVATIEDSEGVPVASAPIQYSTTSTSLLTVFALPDRFLAGRAAPVLVDVQGAEYETAIDRLQKMGIVSGTGPGRYGPSKATKRAEYAVMTLNGLNLKDLRDVSAIKFVLSRSSIVTLNILNSRGQLVASLLKKNQRFNPGEHTVVWDGRAGLGFAPPGRYTYVCTARDARGGATELRGTITIVPQEPLQPVGVPTYGDVRPTDWYSGYLAVAQKQGLMIGIGGNRFEPMRSIKRVEATAVVVRALGLEDLARQMQNQSVNFLDEQNIPAWAKGYVNVAATVAKTAGGKLIVGYPSNFYLPLKPLRRDEAALIVQRLIDKETNRRVAVSGAMVPGATITINGRSVEGDDSGRFQFVIEQNTTEPSVISVTRVGG